MWRVSTPSRESQGLLWAQVQSIFRAHSACRSLLPTHESGRYRTLGLVASSPCRCQCFGILGPRQTVMDPQRWIPVISSASLSSSGRRRTSLLLLQECGFVDVSPLFSSSQAVMRLDFLPYFWPGGETKKGRPPFKQSGQDKESLNTVRVDTPYAIE